MAWQRGSLKKYKRKAGIMWYLRYRTTNAHGKRVEHGLPVGLAQRFPREQDAWREVDRLGLLVRINNEQTGLSDTFAALAERYLAVEFSDEAVRPKSVNTIPIVEHYVRDYLMARWGDQLAADIGPLAIQKWLLSLHNDHHLAWTTVSKIRGLMSRIYRVGIIHERVTRNPVEHVETRSKSDYKAITITPSQTFAILAKLDNPLHYALVLTCAATALRSSELLSLRWADILWPEDRIRVSKRWAKGADGRTKTDASDAYVPMHALLAEELKEWHRQTPYSSAADFVFPSLQRNGKVPIWPSSFVADHLRKAAIEVGVRIAPGQRWGLHNLRHSLSQWLVVKAKVDPKTVQGLLRHANVKTTLQLYVQSDADATLEAQGMYLTHMIQ